jgi:4-amino-4-deoxy-L-arabinose transferase-like glycosyltransferase
LAVEKKVQEGTGVERRRNRLILVAVLACAAVVRLGACLALPETRFPDAGTYEDLAGAVRERGVLEDRYGNKAAVAPGYPVFIAGCRALLGESRFAYRVPQLLLGVLTVLGVFLLGRMLFGERAGLAAAALAAVDPFTIYFESLELTEGPALCLLVWTAVAAWQSRRRTWAAPVCGLLIALTALTRPGWFHICGPLLMLAMLLPGKDRSREKLLWLRGALALAVLVAAMSPWWIRNRLELGSLVLLSSGGGQSLFEGNSENATGGPAIPETVGVRMRGIDGLSELERDALLGGEARMWIKANPGSFAKLAVVKFARTWTPVPNEAAHRRWYHIAASVLNWATVMLLAAAGFWLAKRERAAALWCLAPVAVVILAHIFIIGSVRYRMPAWPFLELLAGAGAVALLARVTARKEA